MELSEATVGLHFGDDGVDKGEEIILTLRHQHTNLPEGLSSFAAQDANAAVPQMVRMTASIHNFALFIPYFTIVFVPPTMFTPRLRVSRRWPCRLYHLPFDNLLFTI